MTSTVTIVPVQHIKAHAFLISLDYICHLKLRSDSSKQSKSIFSWMISVCGEQAHSSAHTNVRVVTSLVALGMQALRAVHKSVLTHTAHTSPFSSGGGHIAAAAVLRQPPNAIQAPGAESYSVRRHLGLCMAVWVDMYFIAVWTRTLACLTALHALSADGLCR